MKVTTERPGSGRGPGRHESEDERVDRNLGELLQELRVASIGVQVLFGFLLSLPFNSRFTRLSGSQQSLYLVALLGAALSTALLIAPVAYHRLLFRLQQKERLLRTGNACALLGLIVVAITVSVSVTLVVSVVVRGAPVAVAAVATVCAFAGLWFALPLWVRRTAEDERR